MREREGVGGGGQKQVWLQVWQDCEVKVVELQRPKARRTTWWLTLEVLTEPGQRTVTERRTTRQSLATISQLDSLVAPGVAEIYLLLAAVRYSYSLSVNRYLRTLVPVFCE